MKTYTQRTSGETQALLSCMVVMDNTMEWVYLELGIKLLIERQNETIEIYRSSTIDPYENETDEEAKERSNKELSKAIEDLQLLKSIEHALDCNNALDLNTFKMNDLVNMELWKSKK